MDTDNVLAGYACPKCLKQGPFNIHGHAIFLNVEDDGCSDFECLEWDDTSLFDCRVCGHKGEAHEFQILGEDNDYDI